MHQNFHLFSFNTPKSFEPPHTGRGHKPTSHPIITAIDEHNTAKAEPKAKSLNEQVIQARANLNSNPGRTSIDETISNASNLLLLIKGGAKKKKSETENETRLPRRTSEAKK